jgi:hypothetical protein
MSVIINASTTSGLVMTSDLSGVLTLQQNGVSLPNGGVAPAFSAYQSTSQTINASVAAKVTFTTETFDTNNNFASSTFTPTVAGYYQINSCVSISITTGYVSIYKNGSELYRGLQLSGGGGVGFNISGLVYFNGSTDYVEIYLANQTGSSASTNAASTLTWFNGCLVRGA